MKILQQSPELRKVFQEKINKKVSEEREEVKEQLGGGFGGALGAIFYQFHQHRNQFKGAVGEEYLTFWLKSLPDSWVMFRNALIPTDLGKLTEIDILIIGPGGIFLIEVKTWKGSFTAYQDQWKRRENNNWIKIENSPTSQSAYHKKMFEKWIIPQIADLKTEYINAPVVFPLANWLGINNCSVPVYRGFQELLQTITEAQNKLTDEQVFQVSELIKNYEIITPAIITPPPKSDYEKPLPTRKTKTIITPPPKSDYEKLLPTRKTKTSSPKINSEKSKPVIKPIPKTQINQEN